MKLFSLILSVELCIIAAGCNGDAAPQSGDDKDPAPVYEAVLKEELIDAKKGEGYYLFVHGKDPEPELLKRLQKQWPELQPGSKVPAGKANRFDLGDLKWIDRNTAELKGTFSNGMDACASRYRVVRGRAE